MAVHGGWSEVKDVEEIWKICDEVKGPVEKHMDKNSEIFKPVSYRNQVVAGKNYVIKIYVGEEKYIHVMVFQALPCHGGEIKLLGVQKNKTRDDPLEPFEHKIVCVLEAVAD